MRALVRHRWRQDRLPLLLYLITFVVMTYPFVFRMHDSLALRNSDTYKALWQNWWIRESLTKGADITFNPDIFHPYGLDVTLDPRRWSTFPLWTALYTFVGDPLAFNLVALIGILFKAYGMYLFAIQILRVRSAAFVAGAYYAFAAPSLSTAFQQPNTGATEWIPWLMLFLACGLSAVKQKNRLRASVASMVVAGACFSLCLYMNPKIGIIAMLIGGCYVIWILFAKRLWSYFHFWIAIFVFSLVAVSTSAPLLITVLRSDTMGHAFARPARVSADGSADLMSFFKADLDRPVNYTQSIAAFSGDQLEIWCHCRGINHLGIVGIAFALMGAVHVWRFERQALVWFALTVASFVLSLGIVVLVNGELQDLNWTPFQLVQDNFLFRTLWLPYRMVLVFVFPFSILVGYGLLSRLRTVELSRRERVFFAISVVMLLYGTSLAPLAMSKAPRPAYLLALETLPEGAVIDVPMGRHPSKYYMTIQRFHRRPLAEGMIPIAPPHAYDYINENMVLDILLTGAFSDGITAANWQAALDDLLRDGFRYLIIHREVLDVLSWKASPPAWINEVLFMPPAVYQDADVRIYDLVEWHGPYPVSKSGREYTSAPTDANLNLSVGDKFTVHGWTLLDSVEARPCQTMTVESWWSIDETDTIPHSLQLILADSDGDGQLALVDKAPADRFTTEWHAGVYYRDQTAITIPCSLAPGSYPLLLGMKESMSGKSLQIGHADGSPVGTLYYLTTINVDRD